MLMEHTPELVVNSILQMGGGGRAPWCLKQNKTKSIVNMLMMVNVMCQLDRATQCPDNCSNIILSESARPFSDGINIEIDRLINIYIDCPP